MNQPKSMAGTPTSSPPTGSSPQPHTGRRVLLNTGALAGSSLWRIAISFVLQVLIARMLGVAQLGQYISALAFLNLAQVVSELGLPNLLVRDLAQEPEQRRVYFFTALRFQLISALLTWLALIGLSMVLPISTDLRTMLWLVGASLPFYAVTSVGQTLFQASERMELVMGVDGLINTLILALSVGLLFLGGQARQLIAVLVFTQAISAGVSLLLATRNRLLPRIEAPISVTWAELWRDARPFYGLSLADVLLHRLDILLLNVVGGDLLIGVYSIAYSLVRVVIKLIQSYWKALYPTFSRLRLESPSQYRRLAALGLRYGLMIALPGAALTLGLAGPVLTLLYGDKALASVRTFQTLVWMTPFFLVEMYAITLLMAERFPRQSLLLTGVHIGGVALLLPPLTFYSGALGAALAMVMASALGATGGLYLLHRHHISIRVDKLWALLAATALAGAVSLWPPLPWIARGLLGGLLYLAVIWISGVFTPEDRALFWRAVRGREKETNASLQKAGS